MKVPALPLGNETLWLALGVGVALAWYAMRKASAASVGAAIGTAAADAVGGAVVATGNAVVGGITGLADRVSQTVMPISDCVAAMQAGDTAGVIWHCSIGTAYDWINNGKPTGCFDLADGKIYCPAP
jgi:hypothetical protein